MPSLSWIQVGVGAAAGFALCWLIHMVILAGVNESHRQALVDLQTKLEKECKDNQAITKGVNDDLLKNDFDIGSLLNSSKRMQPASCIVPASSKTVPAGGGIKYAEQNGVSTDWLYDYAAECETYRAQRIALEKFIDQTWKLKGQ